MLPMAERGEHCKFGLRQQNVPAFGRGLDNMSNTLLQQDWEHKQTHILAQQQEHFIAINSAEVVASHDLINHEFAHADELKIRRRTERNSNAVGLAAPVGPGGEDGILVPPGIHQGEHTSQTGGFVAVQPENGNPVAAAVAAAMFGSATGDGLADDHLHIYGHHIVEAMAKLEMNSAVAAGTASDAVQPHTPTAEFSGSDSGVDLQLQRAGVSNAAEESAAGMGIGSQHGLSLNLSGDSSLLSMNSSELNDPRAASSNSHSHSGGADSSGSGNGLISGQGNVSFEASCSENWGSGNTSLTACPAADSSGGFPKGTETCKLQRSQSVKRRVALTEPNAKEKDVQGLLRGATGSQTRSRLGSSLKRAQSLSRPTYVGSNQLQLHLQSPSGGVMRLRGDRQAAANPKMSASMSMSMTMSMSLGAASTTPSRPAVHSQLSHGHRTTTPAKPDCWPSTLSRNQSVSMQRLVQRTPSLSRARTPGTPSDDGRWPSTTGPYRSTQTGQGGGAKVRVMSVTPDLHATKMRASAMASSVVEMKGSVYGTLPRRRRQKSVEDVTARSSRSSSISRESRGPSTPAPGAVGPTTATMSSTSQKTARRSLAPTQAKTFSGLNRSSPGGRKTAPRSTTTPPTKTRIYHETSVQTALTGDDVSKLFVGGIVAAARAIDAPEQRNQHTQSDIRDRELERLQEEVRQLTQRELDLSNKLKREREEKLAMQQEMHLNAQRVVGILQLARISVDDNGVRDSTVEGNGHGSSPGTTKALQTCSDDAHGTDSFLMLESQIHEIGRLRKLCRSLQTEIDRSLAMQECLLQEKAAIEQESTEMQDFLQHEKAAMCEALKDLEADHQMCQHRLTNRDEEVRVLRDECRHLVRLNEQRRQENRMLQSKYAALESKSKDLLMQQNYSMSGASAALSGLHSRLDSLVEQLVTSYSISEQDLEDIGFQNDMQTNCGSGPLSHEGTTTHNSSLDTRDSLVGKANANGLDIPGLQVQHHLQSKGSSTSLTLASDGSLSPQRNQSFIAAVISAIRNATTASGKKLGANIRHNSGSGMAHGGPNGTSSAVEGKCTNNSVPPGGNNNGNVNNLHLNNKGSHPNNGDDSDSTEMLDSETEPCLIMDNVLEDVTMPDSHSHNMVSSSCGGVGVAAGSGAVMISQIEIPSELMNVSCGDESLQNLSQAIVNRQQMELQINAMGVQKVAMHLSQADNSISEDLSCHDSLADLPSLAEYYPAQGVVDQAIELDHLVTKLLKVLRLIQMDNDNCIQQLIVDKNKLQQNKEDMLEKLKDIQDVNMKLQDELMDATQELMLKNSELSSSKTEIQRHRNEIDSFAQSSTNNNNNASSDDIVGILNLLKMWQSEGHMNDARLSNYLRESLLQNDPGQCNQPSSVTGGAGERLRIYANQLENVLRVLDSCDHLANESLLRQLRQDIEIVKVNANWTPLLCASTFNNANGIGATVAEAVAPNGEHTVGTGIAKPAKVAAADMNANGVDL